MSLPEPLDHLTDEESHILEAVMTTVQFAEGDCIFEIGTPGDCCYIIDEGKVRLEIPPKGGNPDDHENVLGYLQAGVMLGELALLDNLPRSATAYADSDVFLRRIDSSAITTLATDHPALVASIYAALGKVASMRLRASTDRLADHIFKHDNPMVTEMVSRAKAAQQVIEQWDDDKITNLLHDLGLAIAEHAEELAIMAVEETQLGNVNDKMAKIMFGSLGVNYHIFQQDANGTAANLQDLFSEIAAPVGVIFGLIPVTNPVSTFIYKVLSAVKGRNALILNPSRRISKTAGRTGAIIQEALAAHGAPLDLIQWVQENNSRRTTLDFMNHEEIDLILATGGPSLVKAAYSSGNPAIGVGSGNAPVLICSDAELEQAAHRIVISKTYDNGILCASEHNLVVVRSVLEPFLQALEREGAAILSEAEAEQFSATAIVDDETHFRMKLIGKTGAEIADSTGITRDYPIKVIVVPVEHIDPGSAYSREKLLPVLSLFTVEDEEQGLQWSRELLSIDGAGHTAIIYTQAEDWIKRFVQMMPVSRILVNSPGAHGTVGMTSKLPPALTLGCGTYGGTITTDNIGYRHMQNIKHVAHYTEEGSVPFSL